MTKYWIIPVIVKAKVEDLEKIKNLLTATLAIHYTEYKVDRGSQIYDPEDPEFKSINVGPPPSYDKDPSLHGDS